MGFLSRIAWEMFLRNWTGKVYLGFNKKVSQGLNRKSFIFTYVGHQVLKCFWANGATAVLVKDSEGHPDHVLVVRAVHLVCHHVAELGELNLAGTVRVVLKSEQVYHKATIVTPEYFVYEVKKLCLRGVHPHRPHGIAELASVDRPATVHVELIEGLLQLGDLLLTHWGGRLRGHGKASLPPPRHALTLKGGMFHLFPWLPSTCFEIQYLPLWYWADISQMLQPYMRSQISAEICLNWELANDAIREAVKGELLAH